MPFNAFPVIQVIARNPEEVSFSFLKENTGLAQATLNRILKTLCEYRYLIKTSHGHYSTGPKLLNLGNAIVRNQITPKFQPALINLSHVTHLNAELYLISNDGPLFLKHIPAPDEANISFGYGHVILDRKSHPASLFYLTLNKNKKVADLKENFVIDEGNQWPELFRAASMVPETKYCIAVSGMLKNVPPSTYNDLKAIMHKTTELLKQEFTDTLIT